MQLVYLIKTLCYQYNLYLNQLFVLYVRDPDRGLVKVLCYVEKAEHASSLPKTLV